MQGNPSGMTHGLGPASNEPQAQPTMVPSGAFGAPPGRRASRVALALAVVAVLLGGAALVVSLLRKPTSPAAPSVVSSSPATTMPEQQLFVEDADRALCEAIAPLMKEIAEQNRTFAALSPGSQEQGNAIPGYRTFIEDWANKIESLLNKHAAPPRFLTRTLQAYVDDKLLYVELVQPERIDP